MRSATSTPTLPVTGRYTPRPGAALVLLRIVLGIVFIAHGGQKVFVYGFGGVAAAFEGMGLPMASVLAPAVALIELVGGLALVLGLFTRPVGIALALVMAGATATHVPGGFFLPAGLEFTLTLGTGALALALAGPGAFSLDAVRVRPRRS